MCRNVPSGPHMEGVPPPSFTLECNSAGNMLSCQLCPLSPTYWRLTTRPGSATPWDGTSQAPDDRAERPEATAPVRASTINLKADGWLMGPEGPCVLCLRPTKLHSPKNVPCHAACAEEWQAGKRQFAQPR